MSLSVTAFKQLLIPQLACGDGYLTSVLAEKFDFLYTKNLNYGCNDRIIYIRLQLDLASLALSTARNKVDFLKRVEDMKSNRRYDASGFIDATSQRKSQGSSTAFSRADSHQRFLRSSISQDKGRADNKSESHGLTESKGFDRGRTEAKSVSKSKFISDGYSVGSGKGASCFASKSFSQSVSTTGNMQQFPLGVTPKITCEIFTQAENGFEYSWKTLGDIWECILDNLKEPLSGIPLSVTQAIIAAINIIWKALTIEITVIKCAYDKLVNVNCGEVLTPITNNLDRHYGITSVDGNNSFQKNRDRVGSTNPAVFERTGYRASYVTEVPTIASDSNTVLAQYSAEHLALNANASTCKRTWINPSQGRSWQLSYRFGIAFGFGIATVNFNFNVRTQISAGHSFKESETCTRGQSESKSDSSSSTNYNEVGIQTTQGHSNTNERASNRHFAENAGSSKRDAYSRHSSCSYSIMRSAGTSHTDSSRKAGSESTSFGSASARKEGHTQGSGSSLTRTEAIIESRMYSQIFANLSAMIKRLQDEFEEATDILIGSQGNFTAEFVPDFCAVGVVNSFYNRESVVSHY